MVRSYAETRVVHRPDPNTLPNIPLPFYPRSIGHFTLPDGWSETIPAGEKNFVQLFWGIAGSGEFLIDGRPVLFGADDVIVHLPLEPHLHRVVSAPWEYRWVVFDGEGAQPFFESYRYPRTGFHAGPCPHDLFSELETLMLEMSPYGWRQMVAVIASLLARAGGRNDDSTREGRIIGAAIRICRERFSDPDLNVNHLAEELGLDRSTLRRIFKAKMCLAPSEYLSKLRIQHALTLLQQTFLPLAEVASRSGFSDTSYFCRVIRRSIGVSPTRFRER